MPAALTEEFWLIHGKHSQTHYSKNYACTARSHCGVKSSPDEVTLRIHEQQTLEVTEVSRHSGVWLPPFRVTRCQRVTPTCPWRREIIANLGRPRLRVCTHRWACDGVVKRRTSLSTDQVALINPLKGGSLQKVKHLNSTVLLLFFLLFFLHHTWLRICFWISKVLNLSATWSLFQHLLFIHLIFISDSFLFMTQVTVSHTHFALAPALQVWSCRAGLVLIPLYWSLHLIKDNLLREFVSGPDKLIKSQLELCLGGRPAFIIRLRISAPRLAAKVWWAYAHWQIKVASLYSLIVIS